MDALDLMLARRSIRRFTPQDVSPDDEQKLIDAAFAAPSANNDRPWHFVVVRDADTRRRLAAVHEWARMLDKAPLVIAVLGRGQGHPWWIEDCSAATENILLEAASLGTGAPSGAGSGRTPTGSSGTSAPAVRCSARRPTSGARWLSSPSVTPPGRRSRARSARPTRSATRASASALADGRLPVSTVSSTEDRVQGTARAIFAAMAGDKPGRLSPRTAAAG